MSETRIQKLIARYGYCSRRRAETLIREGRVEVDGKAVREPGAKCADDAMIAVDGVVVNRVVPKAYFMINKPAGYLCTRRDPQGRPTVYALLAQAHSRIGLFTVGRLDYLSEGLILMTNDGDFAHRVAHPSAGIEKRYEITTVSPIPYNSVDGWKNGVYIKGARYGIKDWRRVTDFQTIITLVEGKNREIRKLFSDIHVGIERLKRTAVGTLELGDLAPGAYRELGTAERERIFVTGSTPDAASS